MATSNNDMTTRLLWYWRISRTFPFGHWLFNQILGFLVPYSGSIKASIIELSKGHAKIQLKERRQIRNHLHSIHAVALINLGELTTGLAVISSFRPNIRAIVLSLNARYLKKSRGLLTSQAHFTLPEQFDDNTEFEVSTNIIDSSGDTVAIVTATWLIGYKQ